MRVLFQRIYRGHGISLQRTPFARPREFRVCCAPRCDLNYFALPTTRFCSFSFDPAIRRSSPTSDSSPKEWLYFIQIDKIFTGNGQPRANFRTPQFGAENSKKPFNCLSFCIVPRDAHREYMVLKREESRSERQNGPRKGSERKRAE